MTGPAPARVPAAWRGQACSGRGAAGRLPAGPWAQPREPGVRGPLCAAAAGLASSPSAAPGRAEPPAAPRRQRGGRGLAPCAPAGPCRAGGYRGAPAAASRVAAAAAADIAEAAAPSEPSAARRGRPCRPWRRGGARGGAAGLPAPCRPRRPPAARLPRRHATAAGGRQRRAASWPGAGCGVATRGRTACRSWRRLGTRKRRGMRAH